MQRHGLPSVTAINTARSKETGPAGGMAGQPTIPGDAASKWKPGQPEVKAQATVSISCSIGTMERGEELIDAHRDGARLIGKYINLTDPKVVRPWVGLIVSHRRIDGRWTGGRLDFRR